LLHQLYNLRDGIANGDRMRSFKKDTSKDSILLQRIRLKENIREAEPLLYNHSPFPLIRGRGIKGDGVIKIKWVLRKTEDFSGCFKGVRLINNLERYC